MTGVTMGEFEHPSTLMLVVSKIPPYLQDRWMREADRLCEKGQAVRFADLVAFIVAEVRIRRSLLFGPRPAVPTRSETGAPHSCRFKVSTAKVGEPGVRRCAYCGSAHDIDGCQALICRCRGSTGGGHLCGASCVFGVYGEGIGCRFAGSRCSVVLVGVRTLHFYTGRATQGRPEERLWHRAVAEPVLMW